MNSHWQRFASPLGIVLAWSLSPTLCEAKVFLSAEEAKRLCFPEATLFVQHHYALNQEQVAHIEALSGHRPQTLELDIWRAEKNNVLLGYFVTDSVIGKHEAIDYALALDNLGSVLRVEILEYREEYGGEIADRGWLDSFYGKSFESKLTHNEEIPNIAGATLSSRHLTEGIKRVLNTAHILIG